MNERSTPWHVTLLGTVLAESAHLTGFRINADTSSNSGLQQWVKLARRRNGVAPQQSLSREMLQDVFSYSDVGQKHHFLDHLVCFPYLVHANI